MKHPPQHHQGPNLVHITIKSAAQGFRLATGSLVIGIPDQNLSRILALHDQGTAGTGDRPTGDPHDGTDLENWIRHYTPTRIEDYRGSFEELDRTYRDDELIAPARHLSGYATSVSSIPFGELGRYPTKKFVRVSMTKNAFPELTAYIELQAIRQIETLQPIAQRPAV